MKIHSGALRRAMSFLPVLILVVGCAESEPLSPTAHPPAYVATYDDVRENVVAYFDHLEAVDADPTNPVSIHHASVQFVRIRFGDQPDELQAAMTYLWNLEDAEAVIDWPAEPVLPGLAIVADEARLVIENSTDPKGVLGWIADRRASLADQRLDAIDREAVACYLDLLERVTRFLVRSDPPGGPGLHRAFNLKKCMLATFGGALTGLLGGAGVGGSLGTAIGPVGTAAGAGVGGLVGLVGGAATGAAAGCF